MEIIAQTAPPGGIPTRTAIDIRRLSRNHSDTLTEPAVPTLREREEHSAEASRKLPRSEAQILTDIFNNLLQHAAEASEPGQSGDTRENLQQSVRQDISDLQAAFDQISEDNLRLFTAIFQYQLPGTFAGDGGNTLFSSVTEDIFTDTLTPLFNLDVTTEAGALNALAVASAGIDGLTEVSSRRLGGRLSQVIETGTLQVSESAGGRSQPTDALGPEFAPLLVRTPFLSGAGSGLASTLEPAG